MKLVADSSFLLRLYLHDNSRQRPLAAAAGLRVWATLEKDVKSLVKRFAKVS